MDTLASHPQAARTAAAGDAADHHDFLIRSRHEVLRLLTAILDQQMPLAITFLSVGCVLTSTIVYVDEHSNTVLVSCPPDWTTARGESGDAIMIGCVFEDSKIEFQCGPHAVVDLDGTLVVGLPIPEFLWRFQRRRNPRHRVEGLRMVLNFGFLDAEAQIVDLSLGGIGMLNCNDEIRIEAGEVLRNCSIMLPGVGLISVNLQVQRQTKIIGADGRPMTQVGCQFTGLPDATRQMLAHFLDAVAGR